MHKYHQMSHAMLPCVTILISVTLLGLYWIIHVIIVYLLQVCELLEMELCHLVVDHGTDGKITKDDLKDYKDSHDDMHCSFQWKDVGRFIEEEEEDQRELKEDG